MDIQTIQREIQQTQDKTGKLFWREGKLHKVEVCVEKGFMHVHKPNQLANKLIQRKSIVNERIVTIQRTADEKLGMEVKGGIGTKQPLTVIALKKGKAAEKCGQVFIDDVLLHVNGEPMLNKTLKEAQSIIGSVTDAVDLHLAQFKARDQPHKSGDEDDNDDDETTPSIPVEENKAIADAIGKGAETLVKTGSLALATVTSYRKGNDIKMPHTLSVTFNDDKTPFLLHSSAQTDDLKDWADTLSLNVMAMNLKEIAGLKGNFDLADLVLFGWVFERVQSSEVTVVWVRKFLVLREEEIQIYSKYPESASDWNRPERSHKLLDVFVRPLKDGELSELRSCSVIFQTPLENHVISFEYSDPYHRWIQTIHDKRCLAAIKLKSISFKGSWNKRYVNFILDIENGFIVQDHTTKVTYWQEPFSKLKNSSDNGRSTLCLEFRDDQTKEIELREIIHCVHSMEAFISAQVHQNGID